MQPAPPLRAGAPDSLGRLRPRQSQGPLCRSASETPACPGPPRGRVRARSGRQRPRTAPLRPRARWWRAFGSLRSGRPRRQTLGPHKERQRGVVGRGRGWEGLSWRLRWCGARATPLPESARPPQSRFLHDHLPRNQRQPPSPAGRRAAAPGPQSRRNRVCLRCRPPPKTSRPGQAKAQAHLKTGAPCRASGGPPQTAEAPRPRAAATQQSPPARAPQAAARRR
jgi:hypothetical protein